MQVVKEGSFTKAAAAAYMSQQAVSEHIRNLEERYGVSPLLVRPPLPAVDLILAPYGTGRLPLPPGVPVAAPDGWLYPRRGDLTVPDRVASAVPEGFDPLTVAAGLLIAFAPVNLLRLTPPRIHLGGCAVTPEETLCGRSSC